MKTIEDLIEESLFEFFKEHLRVPNLIMVGTEVYRELTDEYMCGFQPVYDKSVTTTYNGIRILVIFGIENKNLIICGLNKIIKRRIR